jgi:hypothetical protein
MTQQLSVLFHQTQIVALFNSNNRYQFEENKMKKILFGWLVLLGFAMIPGSVYACRCKTPATRKAYQKADAVVRAVALTIETQSDGNQLAIIKVARAWKQNLSEEIKVIAGGAECGHYFVKGQEYVLYLYKDTNGNYTTRNCVGNKFFNNPDLPSNFAALAKSDLVWLDKYGKAGKPK